MEYLFNNKDKMKVFCIQVTTKDGRTYSLADGKTYSVAEEEEDDKK